MSNLETMTRRQPPERAFTRRRPPEATAPADMEGTIRPSECFAIQVKDTRLRKLWSQEKLAERLTELGSPTDQATVARTERGKRNVSLDDAFAYAAALEVSPLFLILPRGDDEPPIAVTPFMATTPADGRRWLRGERPLRGQDRQFFMAAMPESEWNWLMAEVDRRRDAFMDAARDAVLEGIADMRASELAAEQHDYELDQEAERYAGYTPDEEGQ